MSLSLQRCAARCVSTAMHSTRTFRRVLYVRIRFIACGGLATIYASARASASNSCGAHVCVLVLPRSHDGPFVHPRGSVRAWICVHLIVCADSCSRTHPRAHTHAPALRYNLALAKKEPVLEECHFVGSRLKAADTLHAFGKLEFTDHVCASLGSMPSPSISGCHFGSRVQP